MIYSAEKLIGCLIRVASSLHISLFLIAVVFTGIEFDDIFLGLALNYEDLGGVALGMVFGTALAMTGVVLALAAILTPTRVNIRRDYVLMLAGAPLLAVVFMLRAPLTPLDGILLLGLFGLFVAYIAVRESKADTPVFRDAEVYEACAAVQGPGGGAPAAPHPIPARPADAPARGPSGWAWLGLAVLALAGLVIGSATTGIGTEGILHAYGLQGTVFGATIATAVLTIEDLFLTVEPARKGAPEIGVGNVIGSVVFSVTGKLGIIALTGGGLIGPHVLTWHLPALVLVTGLAAYFLSTGRLRRWHGYTLLACYAVYWVVSFVVFGAAPVDTS